MTGLSKLVAFFFISFLILNSLGQDRVLAMGTDKPKSPIIGGPCQYNRYQGKATIESIQPKQMAQDGLTPLRGRPFAQRYEVTFSFSPDQEVKESWVQVEGKHFPLRLHNLQNPGPKFLEKYGIEQGKTFDCYLKVITKGSCTPILFEFPTINLCDCFENAN